jgi:hypothetical protein
MNDRHADDGARVDGDSLVITDESTRISRETHPWRGNAETRTGCGFQAVRVKLR